MAGGALLGNERLAYPTTQNTHLRHTAQSKRNSTPQQNHHTSLVVGELPPKLKLPIRNAIASPT